MTINGCSHMEYAKEYKLVNNPEELCKVQCCIDCVDNKNCGLTCSRIKLPEEIRKLPSRNEEFEEERLLGIRCYNCGSIINREEKGIRNLTCSEIGEIWVCKKCFIKFTGK